MRKGRIRIERIQPHSFLDISNARFREPQEHQCLTKAQPSVRVVTVKSDRCLELDPDSVSLFWIAATSP